MPCSDFQMSGSPFFKCSLSRAQTSDRLRAGRPPILEMALWDPLAGEAVLRSTAFYREGVLRLALHPSPPEASGADSALELRAVSHSCGLEASEQWGQWRGLLCYPPTKHEPNMQAFTEALHGRLWSGDINQADFLEEVSARSQRHRA